MTIKPKPHHFISIVIPSARTLFHEMWNVDVYVFNFSSCFQIQISLVAEIRPHARQDTISPTINDLVLERDILSVGNLPKMKYTSWCHINQCLFWCKMRSVYLVPERDPISVAYAMLWYDMILYDMIWYDMIWYDMRYMIGANCDRPSAISNILYQ